MTVTTNADFQNEHIKFTSFTQRFEETNTTIITARIVGGDIDVNLDISGNVETIKRMVLEFKGRR